MTTVRAMISAVLVLASVAGAEGIKRITREGDMEILWLDRWCDPTQWFPVEECTAAVSETTSPQGGTALRLHFGIDHDAGEKAYPVGWPRAHLVPTDWERDWSRWDRFEFDIQARTSRANLPKEPLMLELGEKRPFHHPPVELSEASTVTGADPGTGTGTAGGREGWDTIRVPVAEVAEVLPGGTEAIQRIRFVETESRYAHGDEVEFHLAGFRLVRSLQCRVVALSAKTPVVFAGQPFIRLELRVEGPPADVKRGVPFAILGPEGPVRPETLPVGRGYLVLDCDISEMRLKPGSYELIVFEGLEEKERRVPLRVVEDPWKE